jgi:hypothetical protein
MSVARSLPRWTVPAFAAAFLAVQFYTSLASLSPTPPVGYLFLNRAGAGLLLAILALGAAAGLSVTASDRPALRSGILIPWCAALGIAALLGFDPLSGLQICAIAVLTGLFHLGLVSAGSRADLRGAVVKCYLVAGGLACASAVVMLVLRRPDALYAFNNGRAAGPFVTANQCAAFAVLYAGVAAGVMLSTSGVWQRLAAAGLITALAALYFTFSFGGWIAFASGAAFLAFALDRRAGWAALAVLALAFAALAPFALRHHNGGDTVLRVGSWLAGLRIFEMFPLTGAGPMAFWELYPAVAPIGADPPGQFGALHPHNVVLSLLDEVGLAGLIAVAAGWIAFGRSVRQAVRFAPPATRRFGLAVCAGLVGNGVQGAVDLAGAVQLVFVWLPFTALALVAARYGPP